MNSEKRTLIVNIGSSSKRYALYLGNNLEVSGHLKLEDGNFFAHINHKGKVIECNMYGEVPENSATCFLSKLKEEKIIDDSYMVDFIGIRIVAPGDYFTEDRIIDNNFIEKLSNIKENAPLHIKPILNEIKNLKETFNKVQIFGISDSKFHKNMDDVFRIYSLPLIDTKEIGIYRFGYHGISVRSVLKKLESTAGSLPNKIIVCHLGSGASVTAVKDGRSFNTSMGFTPLEGLTMRTRVGNIDPGALIYLAKTKGLNLEDLESYLNEKCGLKGLTGMEDIKKIIDKSSGKDDTTTHALNIFVNDIKEYIGAYSALMNGVDLLIFTGAIGEGSYFIRENVCDSMNYLGINLEKEKNRELIDKEGVISKEGGKVKVIVIKSDETREILNVINKFVLQF